MTIDDKLRFNKHVDIFCKSDVRQFNVMYRFKNIFDIKEKENIYNTFILANFNYCPTIWHLSGKTNTKKIEHIQECALRFVFNDHCSTYSALLEKCSYTTLHVWRIKTVADWHTHSLNLALVKESSSHLPSWIAMYSNVVISSRSYLARVSCYFVEWQTCFILPCTECIPNYCLLVSSYSEICRQYILCFHTLSQNRPLLLYHLG